nr:hypothetical protein Iba_chr04cCG17140 [Ipomoea batatas]
MHGDCSVGNVRNIKRVGVSNLWQGISKAAFILNAGVQLYCLSQAEIGESELQSGRRWDRLNELLPVFWQLATVLCNDDLATDKLCWALNDTGENFGNLKILNIFSRNAPRLKSLASRMRGDVAGHWSVLFGVSD